MREEALPTGRVLSEIFQQGSNPTHPIPVHIQGTNFQIKVWEALLRIPTGSLVSYQDLAGMIGYPNANRAVATAVGRNPIAYLIPCHRVIRRSGAFGGYRWGRTRKRALLGWEAARQA